MTRSVIYLFQVVIDEVTDTLIVKIRILLLHFSFLPSTIYELATDSLAKIADIFFFPKDIQLIN